MLAAYIDSFEPTDPAKAIRVGERPDPPPPDNDWAVVHVRASSVNRHDVFTAAGGVIGAKSLPRILGMDAAGVDGDGREVLIYNLINSPDWSGDPLVDPALDGLSEGVDGCFAEMVRVPRRNLIDKPAGMSFEAAACLPTAWLTAYRMLFVTADLRPGDLVLVQGAAGGVAAALIMLGKAAGLRMWATSREDDRRILALDYGAEQVFATGTRLPERVDAVMDTVGQPTWDHSIKSVRRGGTIVVGGGTAGYKAETDLARVFVNNLRILGSTMGTHQELERLVKFVSDSGLQPPVSDSVPLADAVEAIRIVQEGRAKGKVILVP
ncbi:zinc-binding dehydrogenase [Mycobacterium sp. Aquia_216]|uniref:zinc-binding dehydrogenase n=1 Tax=Mycobacterium sp. Aquia_216 TaxID=2991729 RepID=UPI003FA385EA